MRYLGKEDYVYRTLRSALESTGAYIADEVDVQLTAIAETVVDHPISDIEVPTDA